MKQVVQSFCGLLFLFGVAHAQQTPSTNPVLISNDPEAAKKYFQSAKVLFEIGRFEEAILGYQQAYLYEQKPEFLYNLAQAYRRQGEMNSQIEPLRLAKFHFETFLKKEPKTPYRRDVEGFIKELEKEIKRLEEKQAEAQAEERRRFRVREDKEDDATAKTPDDRATSKATDDTLKIILGHDYGPFVNSGLTLDGYLETKRGKRNALAGVGILTGGIVTSTSSAFLTFGNRFQEQSVAQAVGASGLALGSFAVGIGAFMLPYGLLQRSSGARNTRATPLPTVPQSVLTTPQ